MTRLLSNQLDPHGDARAAFKTVTNKLDAIIKANIVQWSSEWPNEVGHWLLHRYDKKYETILVNVARDGDGEFMVYSQAEIFYRQQQTDKWSFARVTLPHPSR